jgi:hypothetical protein
VAPQGLAAGITVAPRFVRSCSELAPPPHSRRAVVSRFSGLSPAWTNAATWRTRGPLGRQAKVGHSGGPIPSKGRLNRHDADGGPLVKRLHSDGIAVLLALR